MQGGEERLERKVQPGRNWEQQPPSGRRFRTPDLSSVPNLSVQAKRKGTSPGGNLDCKGKIWGQTWLAGTVLSSEGKGFIREPIRKHRAQQMTWNATRQRGAPLLPGPGNAGSRRARLEPAVSSNPISLAFHGGLREKVPFPPLGHWD